MIIFSTHAAAVQSPKLSNDLAPEFEAGSDFMFAENWGLFAEVKKAFLQSHATGTFGGAPLVGKATIAPWVYATGVTLHF
jgi:outer membrane protein